MYWAEVGVENLKDLWVRVVVELDLVISSLSTIQSHLNSVAHVKSRHERLRSGKGR